MSSAYSIINSLLSGLHNAATSSMANRKGESTEPFKTSSDLCDVWFIFSCKHASLYKQSDYAAMAGIIGRSRLQNVLSDFI